MIAVGLFAEKDLLEGLSERSGLLHGGGFYLLGVQLLASICLSAWAASVTFALIWLINRIVSFRMSPYEELIGADYTEHNIHHPGVGVTRRERDFFHRIFGESKSVFYLVDFSCRAVSVIKRHDEHIDLGLIPVGKNKGGTNQALTFEA